MSNLPSRPLADLVRRAAQRLPETGDIAKRQARIAGGSGSVVVLADVSASMSDAVRDTTKIALLRVALSDLLRYAPDTHTICFSSAPATYAGSVPDPAGGTALHLALDAAAPHRPSRTIIITDGEPDSESAALASADRLTGRIDIIYCGAETNTKALAFLQRLARDSGGSVTHCDLWQQPSLSGPLRLLVAAK